MSWGGNAFSSNTKNTIKNKRVIYKEMSAIVGGNEAVIFSPKADVWLIYFSHFLFFCLLFEILLSVAAAIANWQAVFFNSLAARLAKQIINPERWLTPNLLSDRRQKKKITKKNIGITEGVEKNRWKFLLKTKIYKI